MKKVLRGKATQRDPIAIIGIGCRYPGGANGPAAFWDMLREGRDGIREVPNDRWSLAAYYDPVPGRPSKTYVCRAGFIDGIDRFDPQPFGISPREADFVDPQQRLLLHATWEAFEDAGQPFDIARGSDTGVFVGISTNDYSLIQSATGERCAIDAHATTGGSMSIAANRISYCFNFTGPSVAIDTACSSSLVALHAACTALRGNECRLAIAGGVNALINPTPFIAFCSMGMLSPDGRCKAFDASANGFVRAEGVGVVLLKPLASALRDGDRIYAVIRATAVNQDGRTSGMTVPSYESQRALTARACHEAGVDPHHVAYAEAHGTGTSVGDPIEARALGDVLGKGRRKGSRCVIGSVKTNIGHLEAGAGIAGTIKTALALHHGLIPPNLHFSNPNPNIDFEGLGIRVPTAPEPMRNGARPALACVNSFGFGGTNAHALLEAPPRSRPAPKRRAPRSAGTRPWLLPLSARSPEALKAQAQAYAQCVRGENSLADIGYSAATTRAHHAHRLTVAARAPEEMAEALEAFAAGETRPGVTCAEAGPPAKLAFVYSGQGPQWWAMGRELYEREPVYREKLQECAAILDKIADWSLIDELLADEAASRINETAITQPAICAQQIALTELWRHWGVVPDAVVGHSVGEIAAAHVAGALDLRQAMRVIFHRGRCMEPASGRGRMLALGITVQDAEPIVARYGGAISLAAINGPSNVVLAGEPGPLETIHAELEAAGAFARFVPVNYAFHSAQMDPVRAALLPALKGLRPRAPRLPICSTVTGDMAKGRLFDAEYWWRNVRNTVRFAPAMGRLIDGGHSLFLEISAHPVLAPAMNECLRHRSAQGAVLPSLRRKTDEQVSMVGSLGALHAHGHPLWWDKIFPKGARRISLPRYPWQLESFWHESPECRAIRTHPPKHPLLTRRLASSNPAWTVSADTRLFPYLADHKVRTQIVFPAAAYVEMALGAAGEAFAGQHAAIEEIDFLKAIVLSQGESAPTLQLTYHPEDHSFSIEGTNNAQEGAWTTHSRGKLLVQNDPPPSPPAIDLASIQERCAHQAQGAELYARFTDTGLNYGPAFQAVRRVWRREGEALGEVSLAEAFSEEAARYAIHPALLDSCFQVIAAALPWRDDGDANPMFLPAHLGRVRRHADARDTVFSHVTLTRASASAIEADIRICDAAGAICLEIAGFRCEALQGRTGAEKIDDLYFELRWRLSPRPGAADEPRPADFIPPLDDIADDARREAAHLATSLGCAVRHPLMAKRIAALSNAYLWRAFDQLGWQPAPGEEITTSALVERMRVLPNYERLLARYLGHLADEGTLSRAGDAWRVEKLPPAADIADLWRAAIHEFPSLQPELTLLDRCGTSLPAVLRGDTPSLHVLAPGGSMTTLEHLYSSGEPSLIYNLIVRRALAACVAALPEGRKVRLLEIGAGTGGLTGYLLPTLPRDRAEYCFTDVSQLFLNRAEQRAQEYPFLESRILDIEKSPLEQGFQAHRYDIILASNALHATADLRQTLAHIRDLLAPGGLLALIEVDRPDHLFDIVFGTTDGVWRFSDHDLRPDYPLLDRGRWQELLRSSGFAQVAAVSPFDETATSSQAVLLARAPHTEPVPAPVAASNGDPKNWIVLADATGAGDALCAELRARGHRCITVAPGDAFRRESADHFVIRPAASEEFRRLIAENAGCHGVLHLWALDAPEDGAMTTPRLEAAHAHGVHSALFLAQALAGTKLRLFLVTRGAQPIGEHRTPVAVAQCALVGLGRVIQMEQPGLVPRLIDLCPGRPAQEAREVADEILSGETEEEIAFRGIARYAQRFVPRGAPDDAAASRLRSVRETPCRIAAPNPGSLDALQIQAIGRKAPGPDEVEIEVAAAGINFRDVMKALGIYPTDAGDARQLGDECSGTVVAVGECVSAFKPGDEVFAIARSAFASHITMPVGLVMRKPAHFSHEDAATVLVTFLTAHYALHHLARMRAGERVLIHAASGGVGLAAVQLARAAGAEVFATAGNAEKRSFLKNLGVPHVMSSRTLAFADEILEITGGRGVDIVLNSLAGEAIPKGLSALGPYGRFLEIGKRDIYGNSKIGLRPFKNNLSYFAIDLAAALDPAIVGGFLRDLSRRFEARELSPLPHRSFALGDFKSAFRYIVEARQVGKVVIDFRGERVPVSPAPPASEPRFRKDATYLIAGGLGGFGTAVARWLAELGAGHVVLTSRSGTVSDEAREAIAAIGAAGGKATVIRSDISRESDASDLLAKIRAEMPPLAGIFHAAMVLDDALLSDLDASRFDAVMTPKVSGAWNLHRLTRDIPLEHFVLFSSISSVVGNGGQGNYASANAFLDGLAHHRRALGLPGLSVNWGVLAEVGYVARNDSVREFLGRLGWSGIAPRRALRALGQLMQGEAAQMSVLRVDCQQWASALPRIKGSPRYSMLPFGADAESGGGEDGAQLRAAILAAGPEERLALLEKFLCAQIAQVLRISPSKIERDRRLPELGLDSLMAVELLNRIEGRLGVNLPTGQVMANATVSKLAALLGGMLGGAPAQPAATPAPAVPVAASPACADRPPFGEGDSIDADIARLRAAVGALPFAGAAAGRPGPLLITGATGFIGAHVLDRLLAGPGPEIYCIVRGTSHDEAARRLADATRQFGLAGPNSPVWKARVRAVPGDVSAPLFGLPPQEYARLAGVAHAVLHAAADANHVAPYEMLRDTNVLGTLEAIRFASAHRLKRLHYTSSPFVFSLHADRGRRSRSESDAPDPAHTLPDGYGQTKAVSEWLIEAASGRGLPHTTYRIGLVIGDAAHAITPPNQLAWLLLSASVSIGAAPKSDLDMGLTPVGLVADAISRSIQDDSHDGTLHLVCRDGISFCDVCDVARSLGYAMETLQPKQWLRRATRTDDLHAASPYVALLPPETIAGLLECQELPDVDTTRMTGLIQGWGLKAPVVDRDHIRRCIGHLVSEEFLPPPRVAAAKPRT